MTTNGNDKHVEHYQKRHDNVPHDSCRWIVEDNEGWSTKFIVAPFGGKRERSEVGRNKIVEKIVEKEVIVDKIVEKIVLDKGVKPGASNNVIQRYISEITVLKELIEQLRSKI